jgi:hypothetical protein
MPSNCRAPPERPATRTAPWIVPSRPPPEASIAVTPDVSSNVSASTRPVAAGGAATVTLTLTVPIAVPPWPSATE